MSGSANLLFIDTSLDGFTLGVRYGGAVFQDSDKLARGLDAVLLGRLQALMDRAGCTLQDFDVVLTTLGPGAFTGMRIGLSVVKSFGLALDVPVLGLSTFDAVQASYETPEGCVVVLESKRDELFVQGYGAPVFQEPAVRGVDDIMRDVGGAQGCVLLGNAGQYFEGAQHLAWAGFDCARIFQRYDDAPERFCDKINPLYLRGADVSFSKKPVRILAS